MASDQRWRGAGIVADKSSSPLRYARDVLPMAKRVELLIAGIIGLLAGGLMFALGVRRGLKESHAAIVVTKAKPVEDLNGRTTPKEALSSRANVTFSMQKPMNRRVNRTRSHPAAPRSDLAKTAPMLNSTFSIRRPMNRRINRTRSHLAALRLARENSTLQHLRRKIKQERFEIGELSDRSTHLRASARHASPLGRGTQHPVHAKLPRGYTKMPEHAATGDKVFTGRVPQAKLSKPEDHQAADPSTATKAAKPAPDGSSANHLN